MAKKTIKKKPIKLKKAQQGVAMEPQPQDYPDQQSFNIALGQWVNSQQIGGAQPTNNPNAINLPQFDYQPAMLPQEQQQFQPLNPIQDAQKKGILDRTESSYDQQMNAAYQNMGVRGQKKFDKSLGRSVFDNGTYQEGQQYQQFYNKKYGHDLGKKVNWGHAALTGMLVADALIPGEPIKKPVVQPLQSYNPHPYGVPGSQALMEDGGILPLYSEGSEHDLDEKEIKKLIKQGYKIQYL